MTGPWALVIGVVGCHHSPYFPLEEVARVPLPGAPVRFDYMDLDPGRGLLAIAHMNDDSVVFTDLDGRVLAEVEGVPTARGVAIAPELGRVFVTSSPDQVVAIDLESYAIADRFTTGRSPDGVAWDAEHRVIGVSDQGDGALSLLSDAGEGVRRVVPIGQETGNVRYDAGRGAFWVTGVRPSGDVLVAVDAVTASVTAELALPGCEGAHGLRLHPDGRSAFVACEGNDRVAHVALDGARGVATGSSGRGPDVLAIDPGLGFVYVAAESGDLTVYDLDDPDVVTVEREHPADDAHTIEVDPASHRVYLPIPDGGDGAPALWILRPRTP